MLFIALGSNPKQIDFNWTILNYYKLYVVLITLMTRLIQKIGFIFRLKFYSKFVSRIRIMWFSLLGMRVGNKTILPRMTVTWPHQVMIGSHCYLENNIQFKYDGIWKSGPSICIGNQVFIGTNCEFNIRKGIVVGDHSNIASGCHFVDHDHGKSIQVLIGQQIGDERAIKIGSDVWLGCNVVVLKAVEIGDGAIVGAGAVVTKSIPSNEIWAGIPAKKIGIRE
jgi:acetyltransferase-like isoleucine patch superfamily enzyme